MGIVSMDEFQLRTADKVDRPLDVLEEVGQHPDLQGKLAMHGGTAVNLLMLGAPRLSVDIDVSYVGAVGRAAILSERPLVEAAIEEAATALGYAVGPGEGGHAGRTFTLCYGGAWGPDHVKIDCIYINRSPLVAPTLRPCPLRPDAGVLPRDDAEREYLDRLADADCRPDLLFADAETAGAASRSPEALWKVRNLQKMARG